MSELAKKIMKKLSFTGEDLKKMCLHIVCTVALPIFQTIMAAVGNGNISPRPYLILFSLTGNWNKFQSIFFGFKWK